MNHKDHGNDDKKNGRGLIKDSEKLLSVMKNRRSVREFSKKPIPEEVIKHCISIAASAPSGANNQPWSFVAVSDPAVKKTIREKSEEVENAFYSKLITKEWSDQLKPLGTNAKKPFLEEAPYLICIFAQTYGLDDEGSRVTHYYPLPSVGLATGFLISALHQLGISTLTYTPAPMTFLRDLLMRPKNETPYMILAAGYPSESYVNPQIQKKTEKEYLTII